MDQDDFIQVNLDDVDDGREPLPEDVYICNILTAVKKHKDGSEFPYIALELRPDGDKHPLFAKRKLFLNLSFHPQALWNMKLFRKATKTYKEGDGGFRLSDLVGKRVGVTVGIVNSNKNPDEKVNEVKAPYHQA